MLNLMTLGKPNKVMATELRLSPRTVEIHRGHIMEKMAATSVAQLVRMMMEAQSRAPVH